MRLRLPLNQNDTSPLQTLGKLPVLKFNTMHSVFLSALIASLQDIPPDPQFFFSDSDSDTDSVLKATILTPKILKSASYCFHMYSGTFKKKKSFAMEKNKFFS
jgi:hypothetical protein